MVKVECKSVCYTLSSSFSWMLCRCLGLHSLDQGIMILLMLVLPPGMPFTYISTCWNPNHISLSLSHNYPLFPTEHLWIHKKHSQANSLFAPTPTSFVLACYFNKWQPHFSSNLGQRNIWGHPWLPASFLMPHNLIISYHWHSSLLRPLIHTIEIPQTIFLLRLTPSIGSLSHSE